jgi:hypothetical protein
VGFLGWAGAPVLSIDTGRENRILYTSYPTINPADTFEKEEKVMLTTKRPVMLVKPERSRKERVEEVDVFLSAH